MASEWQSKLARVSRMDWEEVGVRTAQEFHKRTDLLRYWMGRRAQTIRLEPDTKVAPGCFFFAAKDVPHRIELLRLHLPGEATQILRAADAICAHRFPLLGYDNLSPDRDGVTDWHLDPVHGKRAPLIPWPRIPFLDFGTVGDHKIIWEFNRHQHLVTLAKARLFSGDEKYSRELVSQWSNWRHANPYPLGINWGSSLEVAFRSLSWIWLDRLLAGLPDCARFRTELLPELAFHGRYIQRYLSTYFSPNTHLLGEAVALFFLGTLYPQMPGAEGWKQAGWQIVRNEARRQVRPDGVYFEQSLHYHVYALDFFLYARELAARNSMEIPADYDAILGRMLDVVAALSQAGVAEGFGDDDGGRLWNPRRNRTEHMTDPLAIGAAVFQREYAGARLTEEAVWLFGDAIVARLGPDGTQSTVVGPTRSLAFPDGGIYVLGEAEPCPQVMMIDAGPQGVGRCGHGHADALSLRLTMDGRRWLVDSGTGVYISNDLAERNAYRGTGAHNTVLIDGLDQAVADEPFSWTHIPATKVERWVDGKSFTYFVGSHNGYMRLGDPVTHRRHVLKIAGGLWLVRDVVNGQREHELEVHWHFAPGLIVRDAGAGQLSITVAEDPAGEFELSLMVPRETVWQLGTEITQSLISPAYGALQSAPLVRSRARVALPAETATLLQAARALGLRGTDQPRLHAVRLPAVQGYHLDHADEAVGSREASHAFFFAQGLEPWSFGSWSSDAQVLYCRTENGKAAQLVAIGGTHVNWQGQPLLQATQAAGFFEWRRRDGSPLNPAPGGFSVTSWFEAFTRELVKSDRQRSDYAEKH
jgi:hypothetical protein